jgi:predicted dehydrogenase
MKRYKKTSDIKVGVVGYGSSYNMGLHHLNQMQDTGMKPYAVAEIVTERREAAKKDFPNIETYKTVDEMLKKSDVDLIAIITPHNTHAELAVKCLNKGRHVVCEKPMAITTAECDRMISAAKKHNVLVTAYHNRHWDGCIINAVKKIKKGVIGDIIRIEAHMGGYSQPQDIWRASKSISGGILYDWGVHLLEYTFQLIDAGIDEVTGYAKKGFWADKTIWKKDTSEDEGFAVVRYKGGQWSTLCITHIDSKPKEGQLEITGTKGTMVFSNRDWSIIKHKGGRTVVEKGLSPAGQQQKFYKNIADYLTGKAKLIITPEWSRRPIHVLELADKSAKLGKAIKAKYK